MADEQVLVLGDGSWGTALALCLARNGVPTRVWGRDPERSAEIAESALRGALIVLPSDHPLGQIFELMRPSAVEREPEQPEGGE